MNVIAGQIQIIESDCAASTIVHGLRLYIIERIMFQSSKGFPNLAKYTSPFWSSPKTSWRVLLTQSSLMGPNLTRPKPYKHSFRSVSYTYMHPLSHPIIAYFPETLALVMERMLSKENVLLVHFIWETVSETAGVKLPNKEYEFMSTMATISLKTIKTAIMKD